MSTSKSPKRSFKEQMLQAREDAIVQVVNRLLAEKGYEAMTVDAVAAEVGIAKASLYKHFPSKEDLAAAAMVRVLRRARSLLAEMAPETDALEKLRQVVRWTMSLKLAGEMPSLPSQSSSLRMALMNNQDYMECLMEVADTLGAWIVEAQAKGRISGHLPPVVVLYTLYARACDPALEFLKMGGQHTDDQVIDLVLYTCFEGLNAR